MKRFLLGVTILGAAAILGGCPIYPSSSQYGEYEFCNATGCYSCPDPTYSSACVPWPCRTDADCETSGYVCSDNGQGGGRCIPGNTNPGPMSGACTTQSDCASGYTCGQDRTCHAGDCGQAGVGCPDGYVCKLAGGQAQCVQAGGPPESDAGPTADASDESQPTEAGPGDDGSDGSSTGDDGSTAPDAPAEAEAGGPVACNADSDCATAGGYCIDGQCTARIALCSDSTQCRASGEACVDGRCEPHCSTGTPCPTGYACDFPRGVCNYNPHACTATTDCLGGAVCVEGHCAAPCSTPTEAGPACPAGQLCVNGGCIPDEAATFACTNDGQSGQVANLCGTQAICLHHDCYTACGPADGGPGSCTDPSAVCKLVTIETGTYAVCATATNLGSDCDPAQGKLCPSGKVCIDGACQ